MVREWDVSSLFSGILGFQASQLTFNPSRLKYGSEVTVTSRVVARILGRGLPRCLFASP